MLKLKLKQTKVRLPVTQYHLTFLKTLLKNEEKNWIPPIPGGNFLFITDNQMLTTLN